MDRQRPASGFASDQHARRWGWALAAAMLGWVAGTALQLQQPALWSGQAYGAVALWGLAAAVAARINRSRVRTMAVWWLLAAACMAWAATGARAVRVQAQAMPLALEGQDVQVTGVISRMPQRSSTGWRWRFDVEHATHAGRPVTLPRYVQLAWYAAPQGTAHPDWRAGDRWAFTVRLKAPHGNLNPHGFDYELWLWEQGVRATGYVRTGRVDAPPRLLARAVAHPVERWRQRVRDRILGQSASGDEAADGPQRLRDERLRGIVAALVTGDQNVIARADWDVFRATGVAHLMSISGLHITMFAWLAIALVGWVWRRSARWRWLGRINPRLNPCLWLPAPHAALIGGVLLAAGYALFSGWGVPAQRTVLMLAALAALRLAGLRWPWWMGWLLACAVVLVLDPWAWLQAGFWLSFVAVGVLFASHARADDARADGAAPSDMRARLGQLLREQAVVTAVLTPLTLLLFGQASLVGLLANLVAIPWVTLLVTPLSLLGVGWAPLWQVAVWALTPLAALLQALATWPWATVSLPAAPLILGVVAVAGGVLLALRGPWPLRLLGVPLMMPLLLWQPPRPAPGQFALLAADVGQGTAVLVRTATHTLLYDAGPRYSQDSDAGQRVLVPLLRALGERVDTLVLSHRDSDHTGGAGAVLAMQPQATVLSSIEDGHPLHSAHAMTGCEAGQGWQWDGVIFEMLHPAAHAYADVHARRPKPKPNTLSCVLHVRSANAGVEADTGASVLLMGDLEAAQERLLALDLAQAPPVDVLLVPHHGSRTSSSAALLQAARPRWGWVQAGYRNRFGHPAISVTARYSAHGVRLLDSPACGAMHWHSARPDVVRCERQQARRYWWHQPPPAQTWPMQ
ncbi:DNA internalization-related competence protein ComEC/Rec2 [Ottowia sp.]|uniref:DNA internalization-related competence protein ComEC/Rec2 n=1 Tax=Ottowia sp. TaxID=1898956 RepID=UPI003A844B8D